MGRPLGFFISFRTYGTWLHGDARGSVDDRHNQPGTPLLPTNARRERYEHALLKHPPVELCEQGRFAVDQAIRAVCHHRQWVLRAISVRTNHVHTVVSSDQSPSRLLHDFKAWPTRRLVECGLIARQSRVWGTHGSTIWLFTQIQFTRAIAYTCDEQGPPLPMSRPPAWRDEWGPLQAPP